MANNISMPVKGVLNPTFRTQEVRSKKVAFLLPDKTVPPLPCKIPRLTRKKALPKASTTGTVPSDNLIPVKSILLVPHESLRTATLELTAAPATACMTSAWVTARDKLIFPLDDPLDDESAKSGEGSSFSSVDFRSIFCQEIRVNGVSTQNGPKVAHTESPSTTDKVSPPSPIQTADSVTEDAPSFVEAAFVEPLSPAELPEDTDPISPSSADTACEPPPKKERIRTPGQLLPPYPDISYPVTKANRIAMNALLQWLRASEDAGSPVSSVPAFDDIVSQNLPPFPWKKLIDRTKSVNSCGICHRHGPNCPLSFRYAMAQRGINIDHNYDFDCPRLHFMDQWESAEEKERYVVDCIKKSLPYRNYVNELHLIISVRDETDEHREAVAAAEISYAAHVQIIDQMVEKAIARRKAYLAKMALEEAQVAPAPHVPPKDEPRTLKNCILDSIEKRMSWRHVKK